MGLTWVLRGSQIVAALVIAAVLMLLASTFVQNRGYADRVFQGVVQYDHVLASRRYHPLFGGPLIDCTYAIVALAHSAPDAPPTTDNSIRPGNNREDWKFAGAWQPTPASRIPGTTETLARHICEKHLGDELTTTVLVGAKMEGGWHHGNSETIWVYSKPIGVAYVLRYGD